MNIEPITMVGSQQPQQRSASAEKIDQERKESKAPSLAAPEEKPDKAKVAREEILDRIKSLTEDGLYSVRFEKHKETDALVIKLVDQKGEVIRQIPAEEILDLSRHLQDLRANVIKTES